MHAQSPDGPTASTPPRRFDPRKTVHVLSAQTTLKSLYFDPDTKTCRPDLVFVDDRGSIVFEINELGLKGGPRDPTRKLVVVWGDSVVLGIGWSWPSLLDRLAPAYQFLNGGIEGDPYQNVLRRVVAFNRQHTVALNILMPGWHPIDLPQLRDPGAAARASLRRLSSRLLSLGRAVAPNPHQPGNRRLRADLAAFLQAVPRTVLVTMPTALNRKLLDQDLSPYFHQFFRFCGELAHSVDLQRYLYAHIMERNTIVREVAQQAGAPLVDLCAEFDTETLSDFRENFHDVAHLHPFAYGRAADALYRGVRQLL